MAKVIKRSTAPEPMGSAEDEGFSDTLVGRRGAIIDREAFEARSEAQSIRDRATSEAESILAQAKADAETIRKQAQEEGYRDGKAEGATELGEVVAKAVRRFQQIEQQVEPQLRDLAVSIARKILGRELEFHPEGVVDVVRQALAEKARQRREIYLRVHPDDLAFIRERKPELVEVLSRAKEIGLREDPDVARSGVIIETEAGTIDAQLETQLEVFERVLKDVL